jgi:hypothetical protein
MSSYFGDWWATDSGEGAPDTDDGATATLTHSDSLDSSLSLERLPSAGRYKVRSIYRPVFSLSLCLSVSLSLCLLSVSLSSLCLPVFSLSPCLLSVSPLSSPCSPSPLSPHPRPYMYSIQGGFSRHLTSFQDDDDVQILDDLKNENSNGSRSPQRRGLIDPPPEDTGKRRRTSSNIRARQKQRQQPEHSTVRELTEDEEDDMVLQMLHGKSSSTTHDDLFSLPEERYAIAVVEYLYVSTSRSILVLITYTSHFLLLLLLPTNLALEDRKMNSVIQMDLGIVMMLSHMS